jgi:hypothetical protein
VVDLVMGNDQALLTPPRNGKLFVRIVGAPDKNAEGDSKLGEVLAMPGAREFFSWALIKPY